MNRAQDAARFAESSVEADRRILDLLDTVASKDKELKLAEARSGNFLRLVSRVFLDSI